MSQRVMVQVEYPVPIERGTWDLSEETVPESVLHDEAVALLKALLDGWAARVGDALVARNLAVRWLARRPAVGVDPDISVFRPAPPRARDLRSVKTWTDGHAPPVLAIEVVSETNAQKDYAAAADKYAACGAGELWIFDPLLAGPTVHGGPVRLQVWQRDADRWVRAYSGEGPAFSRYLNAYLVVAEDGRKLRIAQEADGSGSWLTSADEERAAKEAERAAKEAERAAKEAERAAKEAERAAKEGALARIAELEAQLKARG